MGETITVRERDAEEHIVEFVGGPFDGERLRLPVVRQGKVYGVLSRLYERPHGALDKEPATK